MKKFTLLLSLFLTATGLTTAMAQDVEDTNVGTHTISLAHGSFTASNNNKTYHATWSSSEMEGLTFGCSQNNMQSSGDNLVLFTGGSTTTTNNCTYAISVPLTYNVTGYSFDVKNLDGGTFSNTITAGSQSVTTTATAQHFEVSGLENRTASFVLGGLNGKAVVLENFTVEVELSDRKIEPYTEIFHTEGSDIPYRIPAIAQAGNGNIIAVADYRYSRGDIGTRNNGRIDLRGRISKDQGQTWSDVFTIVESKGADWAEKGSDMWVGFGDPCIVADRESDRVLLMSCAGNVSFPSGTRDHHQYIARFYSEDGGETWSEPTDIAEHIYAQFDESPFGPARAMFIGSGKISQSKTIKVGDYYRLYCAVLFKDKNGANINFVLYSDDFGGQWTVLGGTDVTPIPSGGDEPKADELPNGSVLISSRSTGRLYNIFTYTDVAKGEGSWSAMTRSLASSNGGICDQGGLPSNGEIMVVPAKRVSDDKPVYILLQSVPFGPNRANVGIYYKELAGLSDFDTAANVAKDWDGRHQSSYTGGCYSTMTWQKNNTLGFLFEEDTYSCVGNGGYSVIYKNYTLEDITGGAYVYNEEGIDGQAFVKDEVAAKIAAATAGGAGTYVGMYTEEGIKAINATLEAYNAAPTQAGYVALNAALVSADNRVAATDTKYYRLRNHGRAGNLYLVAKEQGGLKSAASDEADEAQLFCFEFDGEGQLSIRNKGTNAYICPTGGREVEIPTTADKESAGLYLLKSTTAGQSAIMCQNPESGYRAIHLAQNTARLVPWNANSVTDDPASYWYIEPTDIPVATGIGTIETDTEAKAAKYYDLSGRRVARPVSGGIYVTGNRRKIFAK